MTCAHLKDGYGLPCTRDDHPAEPRGHIYETGSWVDDSHAEGGHG
jgi:hypothetical protein